MTMRLYCLGLYCLGVTAQEQQSFHLVVTAGTEDTQKNPQKGARQQQTVAPGERLRTT